MESRTEVMRRGLLKKLKGSPLPLWISKVKGKGFYVIRGSFNRGGVVKGVVGDVIISSGQVSDDEFKKTKNSFYHKKYRDEIVVKLVLYVPPYDIVKKDYVFSKYWTQENVCHEPIPTRGVIGVFGINEIFRTKHDALNQLKGDSK